jgi:uncharacterized membrane protein
MTITGESQQKIDDYLGRLRARLRGVKDDEVREIVEELRSHVIDKATASATQENSTERVTVVAVEAAVDAALAALGSPEELARQYTTDNLLAQAEASRSPMKVLHGLFQWATLSLAGLFVLLGSVVGYFFGVVFILVAMAKLFHSHTAGLWILPSGGGDTEFSFRLGFGSAPIGGRDVLGWWIVPIGWLAGLGLVMLTTHIAVWYVRKYRRSISLP